MATGGEMLDYPLTLTFKLVTVTTDAEIDVTDAAGQTVRYVKWIYTDVTSHEDTTIFSDRDQQHPLLHIQTDQDRSDLVGSVWSITRPDGSVVGEMGSGSKASIPAKGGVYDTVEANNARMYDIADAAGTVVGRIYQPGSTWGGVLLSMAADIPYVGWLLRSFWIKPRGLVVVNGATVLVLQKRPSLSGRTYTLEKGAELSEADEGLILASGLFGVLHFGSD